MNTVIQTMIEQVNRKPDREQLKLFSALSASQLVYGENHIQFKIQGDRGINKVVVKYTQADLYDVEFYSVRGLKTKLVNEIKGLSNDQVTMAIWRRVVLI